MSTFILTSIAMLAFVANSILCRLALAEGTIDAGSFTLIRLISGAIVLAAILLFRQRGSNTESLGWAFSLLAGGALFG
ncbi:multidrug transporter, partial [Vibrio xuii]